MRLRNLLLALPLLLAGAGHAVADDQAELFTVITSGDTETQAMALILTTRSVAAGANARVLLCADGGELALRDADSQAVQPIDRSPQQMLQGLMQQGVPVEVCAIFLPNRPATQEQLLPGVEIAKPDAIARHMLRPEVRYFTF